MPSPARVVARSVRVLRRLGLSEYEAYLTVGSVAMAVRRRLLRSGAPDSEWIGQIATTAQTRIAALNPSRHDYPGEGYGDGPGGRTGQADQEQH